MLHLPTGVRISIYKVFHVVMACVVGLPIFTRICLLVKKNVTMKSIVQLNESGTIMLST